MATKTKSALKATVKKTTAKKTTAKKMPKSSVAGHKPAGGAAPTRHRVFAMSFASVYPLYLQKARNKGRTKAEVDEVIAWLTGYRDQQLQRVLDAKLDFETFFAKARLNPKAALITGVVCGIRVEDVPDPLMQKIRYLDKLIDELAKGKPMASILRR